MKNKENILDTIVAEKKLEVAKLRSQAGKLKQTATTRKDFRDFAGTLRRDDGVALVAEVKKASPSAGVIVKDFDAIRIARDYEAAGALALSVLTDEKFFQGRIEYLQQIRDAVRLPLLRKDFVIDEVQVYESVVRGADAILLIVAILDDAQLKGFRELASQMRLAALVEVHDEAELDRALGSGAEIIGVNNRDLRDFSVSLATTEKLAAKLKRGMCGKHTLVAESGIHVRADVERVAKAGANAILVGESLMRSGDIVGKVKELLGK
ncbi:MAG TPA: indole-3-glycerol phosphate synthase TrpC [Verrucomicrobiae bacterium]|nr:indole-3-glycerol phosphate synthase TrpC [Verrucomicrobiae bacterium]